MSTVTVPTEIRYFDDVRVGDEFSPLIKGPMTSMHIMRWSAAIENWHRIHYDFNFAVGHDGLPGVIVAGSWKQHILAQLLKDWAGPFGWLSHLRCQYRGLDICGTTVRARGRVTALYQQDGFGLVTCALELLGNGDVVTTQGEGNVVLPLKNGPKLPYPIPFPSYLPGTEPDRSRRQDQKNGDRYDRK